MMVLVFNEHEILLVLVIKQTSQVNDDDLVVV